MSRAADRFAAAARERGLSPEIRRFPEGTRTAEAAARAVGCDVGQIVKTLVFVADGTPFLAFTSGANRADTERLAQILGAQEVRRATADEARGATGFAIGGTPPIGHPTRLRILMDEDLLAHEVVWAAAGTPDSVFPISPGELRVVSEAQVEPFKVV
jgi:prolyl-tRNA editing enzyme YbaK/EbsC (Cys-tRNA(Pro) deacylase)